MRREWNDREVEQLLRRAVERSVPDVFEQVSSEEVPPLLNVDHIVPPPVRRRRRWPLFAAACLLLFLAGAGYLWMSTAAVISIGEAPEIEMAVNRFQRVLRVDGTADDAVLGRLSLEGAEVDDALETVFTALARQGLLTQGVETPVSVDGGSRRCNQELLDLAREELYEAWEEYGGTQPPAPEGEDMGSVLPSPAPQPSSPGTTVTAAPSSSPAAFDMARARAAALAYVGLNEADVVIEKEQQDWEDGQIYYELEFHSADTAYECVVNAAGQVVQCEQERLYGGGGAMEGNGQGGAINARQAAEAAMAHAGVSAAQVADWNSEREEDNGAACYEVEFQCGGVEYKYHIDAQSGAVLSYEQEQES